LRSLVADRLGVGESELTSYVSLRGDLAADSLDFADLAVALEEEVGIRVPLALLERVHTYGDLALLAETLVEERARRAREGVALLRTRFSSGKTSAAATERVFWLDPYAIEILLDDAANAPAGAQLEVLVDPATPQSVLARVRSRLTTLTRRGIAVDVRRDRRAA
jgi:acyl carrier protein